MALRAPLPLAAALLSAACASRPSPDPAPVPPGPTASCLLTTDSAGPARDITAAFDDPADALAARRAAALDAPIRLDCEGRPLPGLAVAWSRDTTGQFWTLALDPSAAPDGGGGWTAAALVAAWRADPDAGAALAWAGVVSLVPLDARRLVVELSAPSADLPPLFADRALAVARDDARPRLEPAAPTGDLRDAVDRGTDVVRTADPALLDYVRRQAGMGTLPLSWHRTYLLLLPARAPSLRVVPPDTAAFRTALAGEAVRVDARPPESPRWWEARDACLPRRPPTPGRKPLDAIAYQTTDPVARDLAERLVALAGEPGLRARAMPADSFAIALGAVSARAFVVAVPRHATIGCRETAGWPSDVAVVPLVETRDHAIVRRGTPPLTIEWDGSLRPLGTAPSVAP